MKKLLSMICTLSISAALLAGCSAGGSTDAPAGDPATPKAAAAEPVDVNIMALKGPTGMGLVQFMSEAEAGNLKDNKYHVAIVAAPDEVAPKLSKGEADIAAVPANLASVLYQNTEGAVQVLAINTLGVVYMVENGESVNSVEDLRGKTIYASGKNTTPEYALNYILQQSGIDPEKDVTIEWKSEHTECLAALMADQNGIAMLPQPFVTTAQMKNDSIRVALDLTAEWDKLQANSDTPSTMVTGVVVARKEFVEHNPAAVSNFMDHYKESVDFVNKNIADAAKLIGDYDIVPTKVAEKAIPACNITFIEGEEMKEKLSGYLAVLAEQNPKAVGGALPQDDFYYAR